MKRLLFIIIMLLILLNIGSNKKKNVDKEFRGIYISYIEINKYLKDTNINDSKNNINNMINNVKSLNCNVIVLQVRPSCDAIYYSKIFPISKYLSSNGSYPYDVLKYFIKVSHNNGIKVYAWINPYRVSTTSDIDSISEFNPAYRFINTDTLYINNGIYFNPSKRDVEDIIVDGVSEVLKYDIDGVLFDDYFYPSNDIDLNDYNEYIKNNNYISLGEYHLNIVNRMIKRVHSICKEKNVSFGVSPDGNIENNYNKNYVDVKRWLSSDKYVDFIMPQLYYGFNNSSKPYIDTINEWKSLIKNKDIDFYIALAFYKVGEIDNYAKEGKYEWIENNNIIMKEIVYSRNIDYYKGFCLYRYDNIFDQDIFKETSKEEIKNVKDVLN